MKHIVAILLVLAASLSSCEAKPKAVITVQYKGNTVKVKPARLDSIPGFPDGGDFPGFGGFGNASGDPEDTIKVEGFKQKFLKTTKAIKCDGTITINSGIVYCKTASAGAEGIEGKQGVTINGGTVRVDAVDDAINANGVITFNGGVVKAESHCNDAVDANVMGGFTPMKEGQGVPGKNASGEKVAAIEMNGGEVYALSHVGAPEEGLDCDFAPLSVTGGMLFSVGAGMGEMPSVPTLNTAKQPTLLLLNLNLKKDEKIQVYEGEECVFVYDMPFSFNGSASILSFPLLKVGRTYKIVTPGYEREVTMNEAFVIVR